MLCLTPKRDLGCAKIPFWCQTAAIWFYNTGEVIYNRKKARGEKKMRKQKKGFLGIVAAAVAIVFFIFFAVQVYILREENSQAIAAIVQKLRSEKKENSYSLEIERMQALEKNIFLKDHDRIKLYTLLSQLYSWNQSYIDSVQYSAKAICYAKQVGDLVLLSRNYIKLADMFIRIGAYDIAEKLLKEGFSYQIENEMEKRRTWEVGYINLAEVCAAEGRNEESRSYLAMADQYENDALYDHVYVVQTKKIILANTYWNEGKLGQAREILSTAEDIHDGTDASLLYVHLPYLMLQSKLEFAQGNVLFAAQQCEEVLSLCDSNQYEMKKLLYLTEIISLLEGKDARRQEAYKEMLLRFYPEALQNSNKMTAVFLFSAHAEGLSYYGDNGDRNFLSLVAGVVFLVILLLLFILRMSWKQGITDALTGLYNRRYFDQVYAKWKKAPCGVIMVDVDHFKKVNDTWGHETGDLVLRKVADACLACMPKEARLFRFGGEEFCVLFRTDSIVEIMALARRMRECVSRLQFENGMQVTISLGVACCAQGEGDPLRQADRNLYKSKAAGRNRVTYE